LILEIIQSRHDRIIPAEFPVSGNRDVTDDLGGDKWHTSIPKAC